MFSVREARDRPTKRGARDLMAVQRTLEKRDYQLFYPISSMGSFVEDLLVALAVGKRPASAKQTINVRVILEVTE